EIGIGLSALLVPFLLDLVAPLYGWLWRRYVLSFTLFTVLQFAMASAILLPPTIMMGATLPALADYLAERPGRPSLAPQWLYTANLVGAVLGVLAAGFLLLPTLGIRRTILAGALVNIGAGLLVLALPRQPAPKRAVSPARASSGAAPPRGCLRLGTRLHRRPGRLDANPDPHRRLHDLRLQHRPAREPRGARARQRVGVAPRGARGLGCVPPGDDARTDGRLAAG